MKDNIITINDNCEAFDWAWALWYWLSHHHEGQFSEKYAALSISDTYSMTNIPDIDFDDNECEEYENAVMYYHEITEENWKDIYEIFCNYMDDQWELEA